MGTKLSSSAQMRYQALKWAEATVGGSSGWASLCV